MANRYGDSRQRQMKDVYEDAADAVIWMQIINAAIMSNLKSLYCPYLVVTTENNSNFEDLEVAICYKKWN